MVVTLEQVEKLRDKTHISYEEAKTVLERHNGDILEALIELERRGKASTGATGGFYTTRPDDGPAPELVLPPAPGGNGKGKGKSKGGQKWEYAKGVYHVDAGGLGAAIRDLVRRSISNHLEVWRNGQKMTTIPILVLILLVVFFFWVTLPLLVVGLFFGCRYRFGGPDLDREEINRVMDQVSSTVNDVRESVRSEFQKRKS